MMRPGMWGMWLWGVGRLRYEGGVCVFVLKVREMIGD